MVYGLAPAVPLRAHTKRSFPFRQLHRRSPVDSLRVRWVPLFRSFRRRGAFAISPYPGVRGFPTRRLLCPLRLFMRALEFRWGLPYLLPALLTIPYEVSRVPYGGLKQDEVGGAWSIVPTALCGSPDVAWSRPGLSMHSSTGPTGTPGVEHTTVSTVSVGLAGIIGKVCQGHSFPKDSALHVNSPCRLSVKHTLLATCLRLIVPFRAMLLTP